MIAWQAFRHGEDVYDLSHLHPCSIQIEQPAKGEQQAKVFDIQVCYSLHCFSKASSDTSDPLLNYSDARETRSFDFKRYELSKKLPDIIQQLNVRKCMHTGHGNFFVIELIDPVNGDKEEYEIYFEVKGGKNSSLHLYVQSAFVRDPQTKRKSTKKISLYVIFHNTLIGKPIKMPPQ